MIRLNWIVVLKFNDIEKAAGYSSQWSKLSKISQNSRSHIRGKQQGVGIRPNILVPRTARKTKKKGRPPLFPSSTYQAKAHIIHASLIYRGARAIKIYEKKVQCSWLEGESTHFRSGGVWCSRCVRYRRLRPGDGDRWWCWRWRSSLVQLAHVHLNRSTLRVSRVWLIASRSEKNLELWENKHYFAAATFTSVSNICYHHQTLQHL